MPADPVDAGAADAGAADAGAALAALAAAFEPRAPDGGTVRWFGVELGAAGDPGTVAAVETVVYERAYLPGRVLPLETSPTLAPLPDPAFVQALVASHPPTVAWERGWSVQRRDGGLWAERPGEPRWRLLDGEVRDGEVCDGAGEWQVRLPGAWQYRLPGFVGFAHGELPAPARGELRVYFHVTAASAPALVTAVAGACERAGAGYLLKVLDTPGAYRRCDAAVLYLDPVVWEAVARRLGRALESAGVQLLPTVPLLTRPLGPGVGLAVSPPDGTSFGEHRAWLLAGAAVAACAGGTGVLERLHAALRDAGIDPAEPFHHGERPALPDLRPHRPVRTPTRPAEAHAGPGGLELAEQVAERLLARAVTHGGATSWVTAEPGSTRAVLAGADVYAGAAGTLTLLSLLGAHGRAWAGRAARRVATHVVRVAPALPRDGFHTGVAGTAAVLAEAAVLLDDGWLAGAARRVLDLLPDGPASEAWDVIDGSAGTLLGLCAVADLLGEPPARDPGPWVDALAAAAVHAGDGTAWPTREGERLAGVAHGASGAALALAVAHGRPAGGEVAGGEAAGTSDDTAGRALAGALRFERDLRRDHGGRWPDLRGVLAWPAPAAPTMVAWCHGAAGIGFARAGLLATGALSPADAEAARRDARVAARDLAADLGIASASPGGGGCLCHGRAGNLLALRAIGQALGDADLADAGQRGLAALRADADRPTPGLLLGTAGVATAAAALARGHWTPLALCLSPGRTTRPAH